MVSFNRYTLFSFLFALCIKLIWFAAIVFLNPENGFLTIDSSGYLAIADNLKNYHFYSQGLINHPSFIPDATRTPLYPVLLFIAKLFHITMPAFIVFQLILSSITAVFVFKMIQLFVKNEKYALIFLLVYTVDIPTICFSNYIMTDTIFAFLLTASLWNLILYITNEQKLKLLLLSAVFLALATLCRPMALYLLPIYAVFGLLSKKNQKDKLKQGLSFLLVFLTLISPWVIRNKIVFGNTFVSTIAEVNLLFHTAANVEAISKNETINTIQNEYWKVSLKDFNWSEPSETVRFAKYSREYAIEILVQNPSTFLKIYTGSIFLFFIKPLRAQIETQLFKKQSINTLTGISDKRWENIQKYSIFNENPLVQLLIVLQIVQLIVLYTGVILLLLNQKHILSSPKKIVYFLFVVIIYFVLTSSLTEFDARFRIPIIPIITVLSAIGYSVYLKNRAV